jgi:diamine N-acetyltransferase
MNEDQDALKAFREASRINPNNDEYFVRAGSVYLKMKRHAEAILEYNRAVKLRNKNARAQFGLGKTYVELGQFADAVRQFKAALEIDPNWDEARQRLAEAESGKPRTA